MENYNDNPKVLRIREVYNELNFRSKGSFAKEVGDSPQNVGNYLLGKRLPRREFIDKLHERFPQYNLRWLLDGVGDKYDPRYVEIRDNNNVIANNSNGGDNVIGNMDAINEIKGLYDQLVESLRMHIKTLEHQIELLEGENKLLRELNKEKDGMP